MTKLESPGIDVAVSDNHYWQPVSLNKGIYVASRASIPERSEMWREYRTYGYDIISTWIDEAGEGETENFEELWYRISGEIFNCKYFILYAKKEDFPLKGALVEIGMALAHYKPVIVVLPFEPEGRTLRPVGSWIKHPCVAVVKCIQDAFDMAIGIVRHPAVFEPFTITISAEEIDKMIDEVDPTFKDRIKPWADQLAADSVACGEMEYGPDYPSNKA